MALQVNLPVYGLALRHIYSPTVAVLIVVALVVALLALFATRALRIYRERQRRWGSLGEAGVERGLQILLKRGYAGAFAIFTDQPSGLFVQFRKYILGAAQIGIQMDFPRAPWSEPYYAGVQDVLGRHSVTFDRVVLDTKPTTEMIRVDFGRDVSLASRIASEIFLKVFERPTVSVELQADDICPLDETVETIDHPRPINLLLKRRVQKRRAD